VYFFIIYKIRKGLAGGNGMLFPIVRKNLPKCMASSLKATYTWKITSNLIRKLERLQN
jgi:hypothetical protein